MASSHLARADRCWHARSSSPPATEPHTCVALCWQTCSLPPTPQYFPRSGLEHLTHDVRELSCLIVGSECRKEKGGTRRINAGCREFGSTKLPVDGYPYKEPSFVSSLRNNVDFLCHLNRLYPPFFSSSICTEHLPAHWMPPDWLPRAQTPLGKRCRLFYNGSRRANRSAGRQHLLACQSEYVYRGVRGNQGARCIDESGITVGWATGETTGTDVADSCCAGALSKIRGGVVGRVTSASWGACEGGLRVRGCGSLVMGSAVDGVVLVSRSSSPAGIEILWQSAPGLRDLLGLHAYL